MNTIATSDIFFFLTAVAVIAVTTLLIIALVYAIRAARAADRLIQRVRETGESLAESVRRADEENVRTGARAAAGIFEIARLFRIITRRKNKNERKKQKQQEGGE